MRRVMEEGKESTQEVTRTLIGELEGKIGSEVTLYGWIHQVRELKKIVFVILKDRTGLTQLVLEPGQFKLPHPESLIKVTGLCKASNNKYGAVEVEVSQFETVNEATGDLPFVVKNEDLDVQMDTLLNHRVLGMRHPKEQAIFKIQSGISTAFRQFLIEKDFTEIHTPKIVSRGAEGGANLFELDYFETKAYLAQSPQFYKQMMVISGLERVFEVAPVFRAEKHSTSRHLNEYVSLDLEMGMVEDIESLMTLENECLIYIMDYLKGHFEKELLLLGNPLPEVLKTIPRMPLPQALDILREEYGLTSLENDIDPEGEKCITDYAQKTFGSDFIFLTHYPRSKRPMYTHYNADGTTNSFDLIFRGIEITTGGRRLHDYEALEKAIIEAGYQVEDYSDYLECFKYGAPPHGGLAIGLERLTAKCLGFDNLRRATLFPRDRGRLRP